MIQFTVTEELRKALEIAGLKPEEYRPAYNGESVGLDLYNASSNWIYVPPASAYQDDSLATKIPTGLRLSLPPNTVGLILQRGSVVKSTLIHRAGVWDPGFTAPGFINAVNLGNRAWEIAPYSKLPYQLVVVAAFTQFCFTETDVFEQTNRFAQRKDGCIGSSDKK